MAIWRGSKGAEVVQLQARLAALGWPIKADGDFGVVTEAVVRCIQRAAGLAADGIVGPKTQAALLVRSFGAPPNAARSFIEATGGPVVQLPVAYRSQRDNQNRPSSTCNVTSVAMVLTSQGIVDPPGRQLEDHLFDLITGPEGMAVFRCDFAWAAKAGINPWTVHGMLVWVASNFGVKLEFGMNRSWDDIRDEIAARRPVILSGKFTGSGHIVVVVGQTFTGDLVVHDPWGAWDRGYRVQDGASRLYTIEDLSEIVPGHATAWAHFVR